ncbi:MAG: CheA signal transduction histidine kinase [Parcubacteria group bacterium GW2011_GWF2_44_8b]|nr:MAG: CheA signal transduction histidine kinase [Parcubacteria group bacterium GW2011_GWC1_43_30]KKT80725.1 MAG: CheA signal transduction histidine kinase [Parcubacteria group bacterium GW2011_GWF2_44_8b]KKT85658.1 MAG: CheA signal transduction histidine kinase [Parcubacteria group bacterium GW2011_GWD1_44_9]
MDKEEKKEKKIVLVEDDSLMSSILAAHLIKEGFNIISVTEGAQAFERIQAEQPSIVLLDIVLPGVGGFDILAKLKQDESTKSIPVLILSNLGSKEEIERGIDLGAEDYLVKANSMVEEITGKIQKILDRH